MPTSAATRARARPRTKADASAAVLRRLRLVFNTVKGHFREVEKKAGVAGAQVWALSVVRDQPGLGVGELAKAMDVHQSTASNLLKPLLENGMLVAERSATDRRAVRLHITPKGAAVVRRAPGPSTGLLPAALGQLDLETLLRLSDDLEALIAKLHPGDRRGAKVPLGQPER